MKFLFGSLLIVLMAFIALMMNADALKNKFISNERIIIKKDRLAAINNSQTDLEHTLANTDEAFAYAVQHHLNTAFCLFADMRLASGKNRLFVYNFPAHTITTSGLVAHGSCNYAFLSKARFSNEPGCGCTAYGKYKIGNKYNGRFGIAYKLHGLDSSNSHAFERNIVLHSYYGVPEKECYPAPVCNSLGCIMVSAGFLKQLAARIDTSRKPVLLWVPY